MLNEGKLEKMSVIIFILKLTLKMLTNNKIKETVCLIENKNLSENLRIKNVLQSDISNKDIIKDYKLDHSDLNFIKLLENLNDSIFEAYSLNKRNVALYFIVLLSKTVISVYYNYLQLTKSVLSKQRSKDFLNQQLQVNN